MIDISYKKRYLQKKIYKSFKKHYFIHKYLLIQLKLVQKKCMNFKHTKKYYKI